MLHNFCINQFFQEDRWDKAERINDAKEDLRSWQRWRRGEGDEDLWMDEGLVDAMECVASPAAKKSTTRNMLVKRLQRRGIQRPSWA